MTVEQETEEPSKEGKTVAARGKVGAHLRCGTDGRRHAASLLVEAAEEPGRIRDDMSSKDFQWNIPAAVAALTALIFAVSATREWAYYGVIGADFISLASPADYTGALLHEFPMSFLMVVVGFVIGKIHFLLTVGTPNQLAQLMKDLSEIQGVLTVVWKEITHEP